VGVSSTVDVPRGRGDNVCTLFGNPSKIRRDSWQLSTLVANISGMYQHIKNRISSWSSTTPPTLDEKMVYFGPQTKKLLTIMYLDPNGLFFGRLHFGPYIGYTCMLRPQIFMCTIETDQGLLAHIPGGRRSPKILIVILIEARVITWVQFLETPPQKKKIGMAKQKKSSKIRRDFWQHSTLIANISGIDH